MKRDLATILWFIAGWSGGSLLAGLMDLPSILAWSGSNPGSRTVRPINEVADELERDAAQRARADGDRSRV